jgi:hypothetical protein
MERGLQAPIAPFVLHMTVALTASFDGRSCPIVASVSVGIIVEALGTHGIADETGSQDNTQPIERLQLLTSG